MLKKLKNYIPIIVMCLIAAVIGILLLTDKLDVGSMISAARGNRTLAFFIILALYIVKGCSMFFPVLAICVGTALVFDVGEAMLIALIGNAVCVSVSYLIGRFSKELTFEGYMERNPKFRKYFTNANRRSFAFCFVVHTSHLSMEAQGVLFGLLRTPYLAYLGGTLLALAPNIGYYTLLGYAGALRMPLFWVLAALDLICVIIGIIYTKRHISEK